jgi:hypothetical protein
MTKHFFKMMMLTQASYVFVQGMEANPNPAAGQQQQPQLADQQMQMAQQPQLGNAGLSHLQNIENRMQTMQLRLDSFNYAPSLHGRPCITDVSLKPFH